MTQRGKIFTTQKRRPPLPGRARGAAFKARSVENGGPMAFYAARTDTLRSPWARLLLIRPVAGGYLLAHGRGAMPFFGSCDRHYSGPRVYSDLRGAHRVQSRGRSLEEGASTARGSYGGVIASSPSLLHLTAQPPFRSLDLTALAKRASAQAAPIVRSTNCWRRRRQDERPFLFLGSQPDSPAARILDGRTEAAELGGPMT